MATRSKPSETPATKPAAKAKTSPASTTAKEKAPVVAAPKAVKAVSAKTADTPVKKTAVKKTTASKVTPDQRRLYVEVAAYHIAERRGFLGGDPSEDWAHAEAEIDRLLEQGILKP